MNEIPDMKTPEICFEDTYVYGIEQSVKASGLPKRKDDVSYDRAFRLGSCTPGTGHDCYLKGITVQTTITAAQYWWLQWQRYHFCDIVSSESKMHTIQSMDFDEQCNWYVNAGIIGILHQLVQEYDDNPSKEAFQRIIANVPMGLMLRARITTNYLQLKTMIIQRRNHKLVEWRNFCRWAAHLPHFSQLTGLIPV